MRWLRALWRRLLNRLRWGRVRILQLRPGDIVLVSVPGVCLTMEQRHVLVQRFSSAIERAGHRHVEVLVLDDSVSVNVLRKALS